MRGNGIQLEAGNQTWGNSLSKPNVCKICGKTFTAMENTAISCQKKQQHQAEEKECCNIL